MDLIERQAAIDAVESTDWYHINSKGEMVSGANSAEHQPWYKAEDICKILEELPSAQPEVIRCKDCKWSDFYISAEGKRYCHCMETGASGRTEDDFCSYAKRREDE